jgi:MFS family permease
MLGAAIMTVSLVVIAQGVVSLSLITVGVGLVLQGLGHGLSLPSLTSAVAGAVPDEDLGIASAANRLMGQMGTAFGITLLTIVYGGSGGGAAFRLAFLTGAGLSALSLLAAFAMHRIGAAGELDGRTPPPAIR